MNYATVFTLLLALCLSSMQVIAQRTHAVSGGIGSIYYYGDLTNGFKSGQLKPAFTLQYHRYLQQQVHFRMGISYGEIGATDRLASRDALKERNLSFRSPIFEVSGMIVYEFRRDKNFGNAWVSRPFVSPYAFLGVGLFRFNPQAYYQNTWIDLQPLGTEGQTLPTSNQSPYSLTQVALPFGAGIGLRLTEYTGMNVEIGYRFTRTDYLDDVSTVYPDQEILRDHNPVAADLSMRSSNPDYIRDYGDIRGNPGAKDGYFFFTICMVYYLSRYASRD